MTEARPGGSAEPPPAAPPGATARPGGFLRGTWELELLISGAVAFALTRLPPVLDVYFERLDPHLTGWSRSALLLGYIYASAIVYVLVFAFLLHLAGRAYWVGLIGLDAVYPAGVRWERLPYGPVTRTVYRELVPALKPQIARLDRFCSVIFSFAFFFVVVFVLSIVYFSTFGLLAYGVSRLFFGGAHLARIFWTLFAVYALLPMIASALDRTFGGRLRPESRAARWLAGAIRLLYRSQLVALYSSIFLVLLSNVRKRAIYPLLGLMLFGTLAFFLARVAVRRQSEAPWHSAFLRPGSAELLSAHYEDQRPAGGVPRAVPSIQSDVIRDPYVRLFIPYVARRHDPYLERNCPELRPMAEANAGRAALGCLERLHAVALDGQPLAELAFFSYTHPQTGVRGMLSYIPVAELAAGAHLLTVEAVPRPDRAEPPEPHRIRFWR